MFPTEDAVMYLIVIDAQSVCPGGKRSVAKESETKFGALRFYVQFMRTIRRSYAHRQNHPYTIYRIAEKCAEKNTATHPAYLTHPTP